MRSVEMKIFSLSRIYEYDPSKLVSALVEHFVQRLRIPFHSLYTDCKVWGTGLSAGPTRIFHRAKSIED